MWFGPFLNTLSHTCCFAQFVQFRRFSKKLKNVFHVFKIVQMVPNRAKHFIYYYGGSFERLVRIPSQSAITGWKLTIETEQSVKYAQS